MAEFDLAQVLSDAARDVNFQIKITATQTARARIVWAVFQARLWLCMQLIRLAVWVGGFGRVEFVEPGEYNQGHDDVDHPNAGPGVDGERAD